MKDLGASLIELWSLMNTPVDEQQMFEQVTCIISAEEEIWNPRSLSLETLEQVSYINLVTTVIIVESWFRVSLMSGSIVFFVVFRWACVMLTS